MQVPGGVPLNRNEVLSVLSATLRGSTAWFATTIISMLLAIGFCLGYVYLIGKPTWIWLALAYFSLLVTSCFLSMITRDNARSKSHVVQIHQSVVNLTLRLVAAGVFFGISVVLFLVALLVPSLSSLERLCGAGFALLLVMSVFLLTKTLQDRREATYLRAQVAENPV